MNNTDSLSPKKKHAVLKIILSVLVLFILVSGGAMALFINSLSKTPDMTKLEPWHPFKSAKAQKLFLEYYDSRARQWPVPSESKYVETSWGRTFIRISGPASAPPLVLIPSLNSSSLIWMPNIEELSKNFRVYAVDNIYDTGRSVYTRIMKTPKDMTDWMDEFFTKLRLGNNINLMGLSLGGWLISQYALHHPERLHKIVMAAPAATVFQLPRAFIMHGLLAAIPLKSTMNSMVNWAFPDLVKQNTPASRQMIKDMITDAAMSMKCFKFKMMVAPTVLSDSELKAIKVPALFLVGEHEVIYDAHKAVARLNSAAPQIRTIIIPGASHDLTIVQAGLVNKIAVGFLETP
jgi:pimeloyl-ACP methyl ester carboxylesterase